MQVPDVDPSALADSLRPRPGAPLHSQLESRLRRLIRSGQVEPGAMLPGELTLAAHLGVSRHTIRHALGVLAAEGLVRRERGAGGGTRVLPVEPPPVFERSLASFYAFAWEVRARGAAQRSFVLERGRVRAGRELAERFSLAPRASLVRIVRLRTASGEPLLLETAYWPTRLAAKLDQEALERGSVYDELERRCGIRVAGARETIRPVTLSPSVAELLSVPAGSPAFAVERLTLSDAGPIEWQESLVRGDRYLYSVELKRDGMEG